jgi:hypothetical protein
MIQPSVRVQVIASKMSCKHCGREYTAADLARLTLCESCGTDLARDAIVVERIQHVIHENEPRVSEVHAGVDAAAFTARISVKRHVITTGTTTTRYNDACPANHAIPQGRAAWVKVA